MGDSEKTTEQKKAKTAVKKSDKKSFFHGLKAEFKRIIWPEKDALIKETSAVLIVTIVLGVIISLIDLVIKTGMDKIFQIG